MSKDNPDDEILEFAIAREIEAYHFYMGLAKRVVNPEIQKVFLDLAQEELEHKATLELEVMKTGKVLPEIEVPVPDFENIISSDGSQLLMDYKEILLLGIEKEDAAFRTYINFLTQVDDEESREVLLSLAQEEVKHKLRFQTEYDLLLKDN